MGEKTIDELHAAHQAWHNRERTVEEYPEDLTCRACGCHGNCECGHDPLAVPEHHCELDINDQHESCRCYCCRTMGLEPKGATDA